MNSATELLIRQQIEKHKSDLRSWANQVRTARRLEDALRLACQRPAAPSLIRALTSLYSQARFMAEQEIERNLAARIEESDPLDPRTQTWQRILAGPFPRLYRQIETRRFHARRLADPDAGPAQIPPSGTDTPPSGTD